MYTDKSILSFWTDVNFAATSFSQKQAIKKNKNKKAMLILKSLVVPVIWLALNRTTFFALNRTFFPVNEEAILRIKQPIRFQDLKDKEYHVANFATFVCKTLIFSPQKMDKFNLKPAKYCIN